MNISATSLLFLCFAKKVQSKQQAAATTSTIQMCMRTFIKFVLYKSQAALLLLLLLM